MKKVSKQMRNMEVAEKPEMTLGLDMGDRYSHYCLLNPQGDVVEEGRMQSTEAALGAISRASREMRIALECGTHSPWVSRLLTALGHQVIVANARKIPAITGSESKNDRNDAEKLARFAAYDPKLLSPLEHRSSERQVDLNLIHARATLVRARTMIVNALRGLIKSAGGRLPACSTESLPARARGGDSVRPGRGRHPAGRADRAAERADRAAWTSRWKSWRPSIRRSACCAPCPAWGRSSPPPTC